MNYHPFPPSTEPLIIGRVPSRWLLDNGHLIKKDDFYNESLSEDDLKRMYTDEILKIPMIITLKEFKERCKTAVLMGIPLLDSVDSQLKSINCVMIDENGEFRPKDEECR